MKLKTRKTLLVIGLVIVVLVFLRAILPSILLTQINKKLQESSEVVSIHIEDLDLALIRGAYRLEKITVQSKVDKDKREFAHIGNLDISVAWRELFKGHILADAAIDRATIVLGVDISKLNQSTTTEEKQKDAQEIVENVIPFDVSRVTVSNSRILYFNRKDQSTMELVNNVQGRITNISNAKLESAEIPSLVTAKGDLFGGAALTISGLMLPFRSPLPMSFRVQAKGFDLTKANPFLMDIVPFSFTSGIMNLYAEFKIEDDNLEGYAKPFLHRATILSREEEFKGVKHFFLEIGAALANVILKNPDTRSTAAVIPFSRPANGRFSTQIGSIVTSAIKNGYNEPLPENFEKTIKLKNFEQYQ